MEKLVRIALAALFLLGICSAQSIPAVDVFGGYSYLNFNLPASSVTGLTSSQRLALNGWEFSASVGLFHRLAVEGDFSGHQLSDCANDTGLNCSNFSYMGGPRFNFGNHSSKITGFVHGLIGRDQMDLPVNGVSTSDTAVAFAAGGGIDYWIFRHVGIQLGPADFIYTNHLHNDNVASQNNIRVSGGVAFRFGGDFSPSEPKPKPEPKAEAESRSHRSWKRPWHKTTSAPSERQPSEGQPESQPSTVAANRQAPPPTSTSLSPSRGMSIHSLGVVAAPQEFDGARILEIEPGSVAEMASLHVGDLIKSIDGKAVRTPMELAAELSDKSGKVRIGILRGTFATETVILLGVR
jgi:hypothetical protein